MFNPSGNGHHASNFGSDTYGFNDQSWARFEFEQSGLSSSMSDEPPQHHDHDPNHSFSAGDMDWAPTPAEIQNDFHDQYHQHQPQNEAHANVDLDNFSPIQNGGGVKGLVAQWENKGYSPPLPPRPIQQSNNQYHHNGHHPQYHQQHHQQQQQQQQPQQQQQHHHLQHPPPQQQQPPQPQPQATHQTHPQNHFQPTSHQSNYQLGTSSPSASSHFGSLNAAAHAHLLSGSMNSTTASHYGSFGGQSRVDSPMAGSPPPMSFGSFQDTSRVSSPIGGPSSGQFGSLDDFMSHNRVESPIAASPMVASPGPMTSNGTSGTPGFQIWRAPDSVTPVKQDDTPGFQIWRPPTTSTVVTPTPRQDTTPGFEMWRPPSLVTPKSTPAEQNTATSPDGYFRPAVPPKPAMTAGSEFILDFNAASRVKGKAPAKPSRPRASVPALSSSFQNNSLKREPSTPLIDFQTTPTPLFTLSEHELPQQPQQDHFKQEPVAQAEQQSHPKEQPQEPSLLDLDPEPQEQQQQQQSQQEAISLRAQTGTRPSREQVPAEAWEQYKTTIRTLYLEERKPLKEVMAVMAEKYGFQATPKMYKTRFSQWGFVKNNTEDEVKKLLSMKFQRDAEGKVSEFVRNGKVVNLGTYLKRKGVTEYDLVDFELPADLPSHIRCRTPTPPLAQGFLKTPDLMRAQEIVVGNLRKAFLNCRQFEMDTEAQIGWTSLMTWGAWSSELLMEANFYFEARDADQGGHFLMRAFKQLESDLKQLSPQGIMELLLGMMNRDLGMITALCKYLAAYSTTNLDRSHPWRVIFSCLYEVQQKHGSSTLSELLSASTPLIAEELEAIYSRRHPYVARTWIDLAFQHNQTNPDRLEKMIPELTVLQRQLEQRHGAQSVDVLVVRYALMEMHYALSPQSDMARSVAQDMWAHMKSMNLVFQMRDSRPNAYCYHSPVKVDPWTKRCRRRYDSGVSILEEHVGVKIHPYFEEDFHTTDHVPDAQESWASAMHQMQPGYSHGHI